MRHVNNVQYGFVDLVETPEYNTSDLDNFIDDI